MSESESDTVAAAVGRNVRRLRTARGWSLETLAARAALSKGMLLQVEQARTNPSLVTLVRIAEAVGVSLARLVEPGEAPVVQVVTADQAAVLWQGADGSAGRLLVGADPHEHLELWEWTLAPGDGHASEAHLRGTQELLHVRDGVLTLEVDGRMHTVSPGGAAAFPADRPHAYRNEQGGMLRFTMAVVQPESDLDPAALEARPAPPE